VTVLYAVGHTIGRLRTPSREPSAVAAADFMRSTPFPIGAVKRRYWDFYKEFGLAISGLVLVQGVLRCQLAAAARSGARYRTVVAAQIVGFADPGAISTRHILLAPRPTRFSSHSPYSWH
jgi:hypothetical protein